MTDRRELNARIAAGNLLSVSVGHSSEAVDRFSIWLLAGFGATIGLLIVNLDSVLSYISANRLHAVVICFAWSVLAAVLQRYLAVIITAGAAGAERGRTIFAASGLAPTDVDLQVFIREMCRPLPNFASEWLERRLADEDYAAFGRVMMLLAKIQGVFVFSQVILLIVAILFLSSELSA